MNSTKLSETPTLATRPLPDPSSSSVVQSPAPKIHPELLQLQVIDSADDWDSIADEWDVLVGGHPLHSHAWFAAWWQAFGSKAGRLAIACVRYRDQLVGIAPMYVSQSWVGKSLRFLGSGTTCTDYMDIFCESDFQSLVAQQLVLWFQSPEFRRQYGRLDLVELEGHTAEAKGIQALVKHLQQSGWAAEIAGLENCWVVSLVRSWEEYVECLSSRSRKRARTALKQQATGQVEYHVWSDPGSIEANWPMFIQLHQKRRRNKGEVGCFKDQAFEKFLEQAVSDLATDGRVALVGVLYQQQPIAMGLLLLGPGGGYLYQTGMDSDQLKLEPGHLLNALTLHYCQQERISQFDFLRGDEPYKSRWAAQPVPLYRTRCWNFRFTSRFRANLVRAGRVLKKWAAKPVTPVPAEN